MVGRYLYGWLEDPVCFGWPSSANENEKHIQKRAGTAGRPNGSLDVHMSHPLRVRVGQKQAEAAEDGGRVGLCQGAARADVIKQLAP
jgi:hypothetical protein